MALVSSVLLSALALALAACNPSEDPSPLPAETAGPRVPALIPPPATGAGASASLARRVPEPSPTQPGARPSPDLASAECGADTLGQYVNQLYTDDMLTKIRAAVGHERIRVIRPGDAVTMDYRPDRLNVEIDEDGRVRRVHCS